MLNSPDPEKFLKQARQIQRKAEKLHEAANLQLEYAEMAYNEFNTDGEFSMQTCENMNPLSLEINKRIADLAPREGVFRAYSWFFLPEGASEGDSTPCDC
jgi:hypothetical protein